MISVKYDFCIRTKRSVEMTDVDRERKVSLADTSRHDTGFWPRDHLTHMDNRELIAVRGDSQVGSVVYLSARFACAISSRDKSSPSSHARRPLLGGDIACLPSL